MKSASAELQGSIILNPEQKEHSGRVLAMADKPSGPAVPPLAPFSYRGASLAFCFAVAKGKSINQEANSDQRLNYFPFYVRHDKSPLLCLA